MAWKKAPELHSGWEYDDAPADPGVGGDKKKQRKKSKFDKMAGGKRMKKRMNKKGVEEDVPEYFHLRRVRS